MQKQKTKDDHSLTAKKYSSLNEKGYVIMPKLLNKDSVNVIHKYFLGIHEKDPTAIPRDGQVTNAISVYKHPVAQDLLKTLLSIVEEEAGLKLLPTYASTRIYEPEAILKKHRDRNSCEYAISTTIGYDADELWPLWLEDLKGNVVEARLDVGDIMMYRGYMCPHWRDQFNGRSWTSMFMFYVNANGPFKDYVDDNPGSHQYAVL